MKLLWLVLFLLLGTCFLCHAQHNAISGNTLLKQYLAADKYYHQAIQLSTKKKSNEQQEERLNKLALKKFRSLIPTLDTASVYDSLRFFTCLKTGELEHYFYNFQQALNLYQAAIDLKPHLPSLADSFLFKPYLYSGIIFYAQNQFDAALRCYQRAEKIQLQYPIGLQDNERLFNNLGALYYETGNYRQARNYFQKAAETLRKTNPSYKDLYVYYNLNAASSYLMLEEYDKAYNVCRNILHFNISTNEINHTIGLIHLNLGNAGEALHYFRKISYSTNRLVKLYNDIANAYLHLGQYDSANTYLQKSIFSNKQFNADNPNVAHGLTFKYLGDLATALSNPHKALNYYQQAIQQFYPSYRNNQLTSNPQQFSGVFSYINLFNTLTAKADAWHTQYSHSKDVNTAKEELKAYQSAFTLIDYVENTYDSDEARLFLNKLKYLIHGKPIDIAFELYHKTGEYNYLETAYLFDQKNKATVLTINQQQNQNATVLSSPLIQKEREIKSAITRLSLKAIQLTDPAAIEQSNRAIRDYEMQLGKVQDQLSKVITISKTIPSFKELQQNLLDAHTAILSYHIFQKKLTIFIIEESAVSGFQIPLYDSFQADVAGFIQSLRTGNPNVAATNILSKRLFKFLIEKALPPAINHLIIIPDDELNYLPFEALQDDKGDYLLKKVSVQYQYSTTLLKKEETDLKNHRTLAFAPFATKSRMGKDKPEFNPLPYSADEIKNIKGKIFIGASASKQTFLNNMAAYGIIHLATHAVANDSADAMSYIAFAPYGNNKADYLLYTQEIYNLSLKGTNLIILSACETGSGSLIRGEGIMSLSRAFAYAGCPNIITSLWKANDESTAFITQKIHGYLSQGRTIDEAVRMAKLDFISSNEINPRMKQPSYWANLIFVGNYTPAERNNKVWNFALLAFCTALIFVIAKSLTKARLRLHKDR